MINYMFFMVILAIFVVVSEADTTMANKKGLPKSFPLNSTLDNRSHEEFHLKNHPDTSIQTNNNNKSVNIASLKPEDHSTNNSNSSLKKLDDKIVTKSDLSVNSTRINISTPKHEKVTFAEGGIEASSQYHPNKTNETNKNITPVSTVTAQPSVSSTIVKQATPRLEKVTFAEGGIEASSQYHPNKANETNKNITAISTVTAQPSVSSIIVKQATPKLEKVTFAEGGVEASSQYHSNNKANKTNKNITAVSTVTAQPSVNSTIVNAPIHVTTAGVNSTQIHKRIHGRPGVFEIVTPSISTNKPSTTTTIRPSKNKPLFTMITGDKETKDSESFIESPTTGRDYVLPIVLMILSLPIVGYLIKIIYRRGTEFTERQQYHRMYLIDGMYNSR